MPAFSCLVAGNLSIPVKVAWSFVVALFSLFVNRTSSLLNLEFHVRRAVVCSDLLCGGRRFRSRGRALDEDFSFSRKRESCTTTSLPSGLLFAGSSRTMAPACVCAPSGHKGSFRCRHHRAAVRSVVSDGKSRDTANQASATCLCAPTSHPGSFRCRFHRTQEANWGGRPLLPSAPSKFPPSKSAEGYGVKKAAFARTNRALAESKLRCEMNIVKAMPEIVAAVEDLRISPGGPMEILTKNGKLIVEQIPGAAVARTTNSINQENSMPTDAVTVKGSTETINLLRSQAKGAKRPTSYNRRLRAKSDVLANLP